MKPLALLLPLLLLVGCIGVPGTLSTSKSLFDQSVSTRTDPAWILHGGFMLSVFTNTKMTNAILMAWDDEPIGDGVSLKFKIDGEEIGLSSIDEMSALENINGFSSIRMFNKRYEVDFPFLNRLADASNVLVRLQFSRSHADGVLSVDTFTSFRPALRKFLNQMAGVQEPVHETKPASRRGR